MKLRALKLLPFVLAGMCCLQIAAANPAASEDTPPPLGASPTVPPTGDTPPVATPPPAGNSKPGKKPKAPRDPNAPPRPVKIKKVKEIPFPLPIGNKADVVTIPENGLDGKLISQLMSLKLTRVSNEIVKMEGTKMDLNHPDGKSDFHIELPASIFNLQTHIITSETPVTVRTDDFELTGDKMEFNTIDRTGKLIGNVHMHIHNLKQVAGPQQPPTS